MKRLKTYGFFILLSLCCFNCHANCQLDNEQIQNQLSLRKSITVNNFRFTSVKDVKERAPRNSREPQKCDAMGYGGKMNGSRVESNSWLNIEWVAGRWTNTLKPK